jgi:[ribosomal protein S5]-alanine N-acetyltransferase
MLESTSREVRTERLLLRPFRRGDVAAIARYTTDEEYRRYLSPTHPGAEEFVAHNVGIDWSVERSWVITLDGEVVGSVFLGINADDDAAELSCLVARDFWGMEIGVEASRAAIEHAFVELDLAKVAARADARHDASIRVMEKLGMRRNGLSHSHRAGRRRQTTDEVIYEIERAEWQAGA